MPGSTKFIYVCSFFVLVVTIAVTASSTAQTVASHQREFTRQDRLRGSITPERMWWDLQHYNLNLEVFPESKSIKGSNIVTFKTTQRGQRMQIDLQEPLEITRIVHGDFELKFTRESSVYWVEFANELAVDEEHSIKIEYGGKPVESENPPWSGGFSWQKDEKENHFIATSCQGIGASIWWPCKDHGYDEPDLGVNIGITVPEDLTAVSNGRLTKVEENEEANTRTFHWWVRNPINNYCVNVNIGNYVNFSDTYEGEFGKLDLDYWVLDHQRAKAERHFKEVPRTIKAFEHWFGIYPFYADSYKLVAVPYAGMEHQSSVTYGNNFENGYRGRDLSDTGVGFKFDFIIVHESGHEWFGNNISMKDGADMWIHESFTNYSENLFVEYHFTEKEAQDYVVGCRALVKNDRPIIGTYDLNHEGSGDMYYKGGNMLHTIRHVIDDDETWRSILRGLNSKFWHSTVESKQIEDYISKRSGMDLSKVFDQYLRTTMIPKLYYKINGTELSYWYGDVVDGFDMPVDVAIHGKPYRLSPSTSVNVLETDSPIEEVELDRNYYVELVESR